jgi:hypothetical protein
MARGSTADHGCNVRKGPEERRNARSVAPHRAEASETNSEKLAAARASAILGKPVLRISRGCSYSNLKARSANSGPSSYWGLAIVPGVASSGRISGRDRLPAGPLEVVPDQAGGSNVEANLKVQPPSARAGKFSQDDFRIDLEAQNVQCPAGRVVRLRVLKDGAGEAQFGACCEQCPLRSQCTDSKHGRTVYVHPKHRVLDRARRRRRDPLWKERYRATRPKVERKIAHLMRRRHGGSRARVRGKVRVGHDFSLLAAALNLARLAKLGVRRASAAY